MLFSSPTFLFVFLPLVLLAYALSPRPVRNLTLFVASLLFYTWGEKTYVILLLASIAANYVGGLWVERTRDRRGGMAVLLAGVVVNLAALVGYKYLNFLADNLNLLLGLTGGPQIHLKPVHLPLGISFLTFEAISYLVDISRRVIPAERNPLRFALYLTLFPHLIAGPIVRYADLGGQLADRHVTRDGFAEGIRRFVIGLGKKMLIANPLAVTVDAALANPASELSGGLAWMIVVGYALQLYFDFSGYSDMAIGLGKMFGIDFAENFNYPYAARSMTEFWRRWHMSLSSWFRDYVYIPLGGNRCSVSRQGLNLLIVFLLCGAWHGAAWNFILWGLLHGLFLVLERIGGKHLLERLPVLVRHAYVLFAVVIVTLFLRAPTAADGVTLLGKMATFSTGSFTVADYWTREFGLALLVGLVGAVPTLPWLIARFDAVTDRLAGWRQTTVLAAARVTALTALAVVLLAATVQLAVGSYNPFIYFRF